MAWILKELWLVPVLPTISALAIAITRKNHKIFAIAVSIGTLALSFLLSLFAFAATVNLVNNGENSQKFINFRWLQLGNDWIEFGWILDPLTAVMLVMVTFVGLLIFIYSAGYMAKDENLTRFFCFLSLFAGAMLGIVISNSLLSLFICWEIVSLTSYLLIGFWYFKPSAAAAAKKAFITTRIGDLAFLLGIVWLYSKTQTLLFYDNGAGCLEHSTLINLLGQPSGLGISACTAIALLIFVGAIGKSGQFPLHIWLPDAMEGPTPVSALIHAATMVAAGVFLLARTYPLISAERLLTALGSPTTTLTVVTWIGAVTAFFAASIAVVQNDIKRILAYSTISQLGYMMIGLGTGGPAIGMFHLITHAFFKALLFLGAGSVIHGSHHEQDIRRMGGLKQSMPITFATYTVGALALCGFPLFFSGFWSKEAILHSASLWTVSRFPFWLGMAGVVLTAFYMGRQVIYVFLGRSRLENFSDAHSGHESPPIMTGPLILLAAFSVLLGAIGTPIWPWFYSFLAGSSGDINLSGFSEHSVLFLMAASTILVFVGLGSSWRLYGKKITGTDSLDPLELSYPKLTRALQNGLYVDRFYDKTFVRGTVLVARVSDWIERSIWNGIVRLLSYLAFGLSWLTRLFDLVVINPSFDRSCDGISRGGSTLSRLQNGHLQTYLRAASIAFAMLMLFLIWGRRG